MIGGVGRKLPCRLNFKPFIDIFIDRPRISRRAELSLFVYFQFFALIFRTFSSLLNFEVYSKFMRGGEFADASFPTLFPPPFLEVVLNLSLEKLLLAEAVITRMKR
jgi:hypothetical protein